MVGLTTTGPGSRPSPAKRPRLAVTLAIALLSTGSAEDAFAECVSIRLDAPVRLPDGSVHEAGSLRLCDSIRFSPVSSLHATYVNGASLGYLQSHRKRSEAGGEESPVVYFSRNDLGQLELVGYVVPGADASVTYMFTEVLAGAPRAAASSRKPLSHPLRQPQLVAVAVSPPH
jgi:hypothetical protein